MRDWIKRNKRLIALKIAIAAALVVTHYYPDAREASVFVNLLWLFLF